MAQVFLSFADGADTDIPLPRYATAGAAGADICANLPDDTREMGITLLPTQRALIPTGLRMAIQDGFEVQVRPRSGLALKNGIALVNAPGTIDCDYRGPVGIILINHGSEPFNVTHGMRIAQIVVAPVVQAAFQVVDDLDETTRGAGGFGSTGTAP